MKHITRYNVIPFVCVLFSHSSDTYAYYVWHGMIVCLSHADSVLDSQICHTSGNGVTVEEDEEEIVTGSVMPDVDMVVVFSDAELTAEAKESGGEVGVVEDNETMVSFTAITCVTPLTPSSSTT